jgi:nicotinamidase/pyrazinamidase
VKRLFVCGLATDYCVKATVLDGLKLGYEVYLLVDAIKGVNVRPGDSEEAINEMVKAKARLLKFEQLL